jgi:hypothetical protein
MSRIRAAAAAVLVLAASTPTLAVTAPPVLINSSHASQFVTRDLLVLHPELNSGAGLGAIDNTCGGGTTVAVCSTNAVFDATMIADTQNTSLANINVASAQYPVNHAPYTLVNNSFAGYSFTGFGDPATYIQLNAYGVLMSWAFVAAGPSGTPPPITSVTVTATSGPASLPGANWGLEFGLVNNYKGFDTSAPSWVTAAMTAILAAMRVDHASWSWFEIIAALRQTASNWTTGWNADQFGYGAIDYDSATALSSPAALYLQPPILQMTNTGTDARVTLYPFRTARRAYEVVYLVPGTYTFPIKNELTTADIAALVAAGGQLVFTGNGTDVIPSGSGTFTPTLGVVYTMVAFTTDGAGAYSRVEAWSRQGTITIPGSGCICRQQ